MTYTEKIGKIKKYIAVNLFNEFSFKNGKARKLRKFIISKIIPVSCCPSQVSVVLLAVIPWQRKWWIRN
ncbi:MAG TPA: hypothetical protein VKA09_15575 [Nitrososphaeraceae archaeon]|nr:hypothetical protein [Nitrososphaeraceae archaeon]